MGTVALGSFIIFVAKLVCYAIKAMMNNRFARVLRLCCDISDVIERFIQFLNKNTYIMVAIHGNPFCQSMRDAFNLLMRNIASVSYLLSLNFRPNCWLNDSYVCVQVYVTNKVTALQFGIFNIAIASGMGGLTYLFLPVADTEAQSKLIIYPILVSVIGSSIVAATFFGVYSMAIDTLFLCFCKCNMQSFKLMYPNELQLIFWMLLLFFNFSGGLRAQRRNWRATILHVTAINESSTQESRKSPPTALRSIKCYHPFYRQFVFLFYL